MRTRRVNTCSARIPSAFLEILSKSVGNFFRKFFFENFQIISKNSPCAALPPTRRSHSSDVAHGVAAHSPTVLALTGTLLDALGGPPPPMAGDLLGLLISIQKSVLAMALHHCAQETDPPLPLDAPANAQRGPAGPPPPPAPRGSVASTPSMRATSPSSAAGPYARAGAQYMKRVFFPYMQLLFTHMVKVWGQGSA